MDENGVLREDNASLNTVQLLGVEDYNRAFGASQVLAEDEALLWCCLLYTSGKPRAFHPGEY